MERRALVVYNPASGRRRHRHTLEAILEALRAGGYAASSVPTQRRAHAIEIAREAAASGCHAVFAFGGDGTVREVAEGLLGSDTALGVLPGGTTNVVSIAFGLGQDPVAAARRQCGVLPRPIDVGLCAGRAFLMQASSGLEAYLMARLDPRVKARFGFAGAVAQGIGAWFRYRYPALELRVDGEALRVTGALVCNISEVAGPYRMIPSGAFDDGQLDLLLFRGTTRAAVLSFCIDLYRGTHGARPDVEIRQVGSVVFEGPPEAFVQIDGDSFPDRHPIEVRLSPSRLKALAPR